MTLGIFGAALFFGDGMITPAISVLGAIQGVQVATPALAHLVVPLSVAILLSQQYERSQAPPGTTSTYCSCQALVKPAMRNWPKRRTPGAVPGPTGPPAGP